MHTTVPFTSEILSGNLSEGPPPSPNIQAEDNVSSSIMSEVCGGQRCKRAEESVGTLFG